MGIIVVFNPRLVSEYKWENLTKACHSARYVYSYVGFSRDTIGLIPKPTRFNPDYKAENIGDISSQTSIALPSLCLSKKHFGKISKVSLDEIDQKWKSVFNNLSEQRECFMRVKADQKWESVFSNLSEQMEYFMRAPSILVVKFLQILSSLSLIKNIFSLPLDLIKYAFNIPTSYQEDLLEQGLFLKKMCPLNKTVGIGFSEEDLSSIIKELEIIYEFPPDLLEQ